MNHTKPGSPAPYTTNMLQQLIIVDDNELFRTSLCQFIEADGKFTKCAHLAIDELLTGPATKNKASLIIVDPFSKEKSPAAIFKFLTNKYKDVPIMVFTNTVTKRAILECIEYGVSAYFTKSITSSKLKKLVYELSEGESTADIRLQQKVKNVLRSKSVDLVEFTAAEEEVLRLVCQQKSSVEISKDLGISSRTVESRKRNMMLKTKSKNMIGVIVYGMKIQLLDRILD